MLMTVKELREWVTSDLSSLVDALATLTGRGGDSERFAWNQSLPRLSDALASEALAKMHVHFAEQKHHLDIEYQLPGAQSWCDAVLLGKHEGRPSAVVVELKEWDTRADRPGIAEGLIERKGRQELHPSDQVRGYVSYCQRFNSAVVDQKAQVHGFVLLTAGLMKYAYVAEPNKTLSAEYPLFTMSSEDIEGALPAFLASRISENDEKFAAEFSSGTFKQDRGFMSQIGKAILAGDTKQFELLDNQRRAFNLCLATTKDALNRGGSKRVIVVHGPPGSGKSAVAARLWASLVADESVPEGNVLLVTTSLSQNSNWTYLVDRASANRAGRGVARKATSFPPLDIPRLKRLRNAARNPDLYRDAARWRQSLLDLDQSGTAARPGAESNSVLVSLVDEAHALINTEREYGVGQHGFVSGLGPQAYHIIRCSQITVFFLDPEQSFRIHENTKVDDLKTWAEEFGASFESISLEGAQFRCAGSAEYVEWVESILSGTAIEMNRVYASAWHREDFVLDQKVASTATGNVVAFPVSHGASRGNVHAQKVAEPTGSYRVVPLRKAASAMRFEIFSDPFLMERELRNLSSSNSVRLVSTYSRPWNTRDSAYPHREAPQQQDFSELVTAPDGSSRLWSRPWNFVPGQDYTGFVAGRPGLPIHEDPLCEVGCTYAVRGFDFDYLGLLWLNDLVWRNGAWTVPLANVHESGISMLVRQARREGLDAPNGPRGRDVLAKVTQAYRILLTRALKGMFVWIPDAQTREYVEASLKVSN